MSTLLQEIEAQIAGVKTAVARQNVGLVREISDGVAKIEGLTDAMLNETLDFGDGVMGLALNLEETEVGAIILGDYKGIKEGQEVRTTGRLLQVPAGKALLGRVVDTLGRPLDGRIGGHSAPVAVDAARLGGQGLGGGTAGREDDGDHRQCGEEEVPGQGPRQGP